MQTLYERFYAESKPNDALQKQLEELRSKDLKQKQAAARAIRHYVIQEARERSEESFAKMLNMLLLRISSWSLSSSNSEKIGCILLLDELIDALPVKEMEKKMSQFANELSVIIVNQNKARTFNSEVVDLAVRSLGHLASGNPIYTAVIVDAEVKRALEWIDGGAHDSQYTAVLVLKEMALKAPTLFYKHTDAFFKQIWKVLVSPKADIRKEASLALRHALRLVQKRASRKRTKWYEEMFDNAKAQFPQLGQPWNGSLSGGKDKDKDKDSGSSSSPGRKLFKFSLTPTSRSDELVVVNSSSVRPSKDVASIHGALLIFYELIGESLGVFMNSGQFTEVFISCVWLKEIREHKSSVIREAVMNLLPRIAWLCPMEIIEDFVETCMVYLMGVIEASQRVRKTTSFRSPLPSDGHIAFLALGKLAVVSTVLDAFVRSKHLRDLLILIRHSLHLRKRVTHIKEALLCLTAIVETHGVPDNCADVLVDIATLLIKAKLSIPMISALAAIGNAMPNQLEAVEPLLLSQLTSILAKDIRRDIPNEPQQGSRSRSFSNSSVEYTGSSHNLLRESVAEAAPKRNVRTIRKMIKSMASSKQDLIRLQHLALRTLAVFRFEEADLVPLVCNYALRYLNSSDLETRGEAILVTCQVMSTRGRNDRVLAGRRGTVDREKAVAVAHIVERLVIAALTDREPMIRKLVVERLLCDFSEELLMNRENTLSFFTLAQDQFFDIRAIAVSALGELAGRRPCELMPKLQLVLVRLMSELEYAGTVKQQEEATTLIGLLVRAMGQELSSPYISTIVRTFLSKLEDSTSPVIAAMLATLGEIALVCGEVPLQEVLSTVLPVILGVIEEPQSTPLQLEVALSSLAKIASNAVVSIWPYFYHRQLLDCILTLLMSASSSTSLRRQCMVTIGTLGALDPWLHKVNQKNFASGDPGVPYLHAHQMKEERSMPQVVQFEAKETTIPIDPPPTQSQTQTQETTATNLRSDARKRFLWRSKLPSFYGVKMPLEQPIEAATRKPSPVTTRRRSEILGTTDAPAMPLKTRRKSSQASLQRVDLLEVSKTRSKSSTEKTEGEGEVYRRKSSIRQMLEVAVLSTQGSPAKAAQHGINAQVKTGYVEGKEEDMQHQMKRMRSFEEAERTSAVKGVLLPSVQRFNLDRNNEETAVNAAEPSSILPSMVSHVVDYYPTVAITALTKLLKDANASSSHKAVLDSTILIFRSLGDRCGPFLPGILGPILQVVQLNALGTKAIDQRVGYIEELGNLLDIVGEHLGPYLDEIFMLAADLWDSDLLEQVLQVLFKLVSRLDPKEVHLPLSILLKPLLALLCKDPEPEQTEGRSVDLALKVLAAFRSALNNYLHLVLPSIVALVDRSTFSSGVVLRVRLAAMDALNQIIRACSVADFATLIVHPLVHALEDISSDTLQYSNLPKKVTTSAANVETGLDAVPVNKKERIEQRVLRQILALLTSLLYKLEEEYVMFATIIDEPLREAVGVVFGANYQSFLFSAKTTSSDEDLELVDLYFHLVQRVIYGQAIDKPLWSAALVDDANAPLQELGGVVESAPGKRGHSQSNAAFRHEMDLNNLRDAWDTSQSSTEEDWIEWMRSFALELLKESPQQGLRACFRLAQVNEALGLDLFNAAFLSCWTEMDSGRQETLIDALEHALKSQNVPNELLQTLLNLAEFMEHTDNALPMDIRMLSDLALRCQAHAKALHYRELEFQASPHTCIEELIAINNNLEQPEAAAGIVVYARKTYPDSIEVEPWWYERLKKWEEALSEYERKQSEASARGEEANSAYDLGKLRCFQALGDWSSTASFAIERWKHIVGLTRTKSSLEDAHGRRPGNVGFRLNPKALKLDDNQDKAISYLQEVLVDSFPGVSSNLLSSDANTFYLRDAINTAHPIATLISSRTEHKQSTTPVPMLYERTLQMDRIQRAPSESSAYGLNPPSGSVDNVNTPGGTFSSYAQTVASLGANALWVLERWDEMASFVSVASAGNIDGCFLSIVYALHQQDYRLTQSYIDHAYQILGTKLSTLVVESYGRAYPRLVKVQQLRELEEILKFKMMETDSPEAADEYLSRVKRLWTQRLHGMQQSVEVLLPTMVIRSLVVHPEDDVDAWLNFAKVCRKQGRVRLTLKVLMNLGVGSVPHYILSFTDGLVRSGQQPLIPSKAKRSIQAHPRVALAYLKHLWTVGFQTEALKRLRELSEIAYGILDKRQDAAFSSNTLPVLRARSSRELSKAMRCLSFTALSTMELRRLLVSCLCRLGTWMSTGVSPATPAPTASTRSATGRLSITGTIAMSMAGRERRSGYNGINLIQGVEDVLGCYELATQLDKHSYKAWHAWALANYRALAISDGSNVTVGGEGASNGNLSHVLAAMEGFFQSITLGKQDNVNVLQDILRLLTLWLTHRDEIPVMGTISRGFELLPIDTWLDVIPQLIARIRSPGDLVCELLEQIGREHPQVLIYPLTVASKSDKPHRAKAALQVMKVMQKDFPVIVNEALVVSRELIRIAVLWNEMWHEGLEEACRLLFSEKRSADEMIAVLAPLHALMEQGPETMHEVAFYHAFGRDLETASEWLYKYNTTPNAPATYLNQAWDLYYNVFKAISQELDHHPLELKFISPGLLQAKHLQLAVPGSYKAGADPIRIEGFSSTVKIMPSKQRPRVVALRGSDGETHRFLLKGHEDLRMDERAMQLFTLVNTLLSTDANTNKQNLEIQGYKVVPLSSKAGVLGWVANTDTLHKLIKEYRENRKILVNIEHKLMIQMAPEYERLTVPQKIEVLNYALEETSGQDLARVLWLKSQNSEVWLERRTNYVRSLATMSMVGYILGLGDRHPSNLMLDRESGKIVHIDFGDCFEVTMDREKFSEKVPFRLTRMLINAMEASKIEGNYRYTCKLVMQVLRENHESVMTMLEAFVHDPLITWRILGEPVVPNDDELDTPFPLQPRLPLPYAQSSGSDFKNVGYSSSSGSGSGSSASSSDEEVVEAHSVSASASVSTVKLNQKAVKVIARVRAKLQGQDFTTPLGEPLVLDVSKQVDRLIEEASSRENLCQLYLGWCPFW